MDFLFDIVKQLAASLSPTQFLWILGIIAGTTFFLVRFILANKKKIVSWLTGQKEVDETQVALQDIKAALLKLLTTQDFQQDLARLDVSIKLALTAQAADLEAIREKLVELSSIKTELVTASRHILDELSEIKHTIHVHNDGSQTQYRDVLLQLNKSHELIARNLMQIEKMDEFFKATVPEFRGYHHELGTELNNLSRDIALVERSIQMQMNSGLAVKLR
jgi:homoserine dehydrogenase